MWLFRRFRFGNGIDYFEAIASLYALHSERLVFNGLDLLFIRLGGLPSIDEIFDAFWVGFHMLRHPCQNITPMSHSCKTSIFSWKIVEVFSGKRWLWWKKVDI
jgi:hypothetical protein